MNAYTVALEDMEFTVHFSVMITRSAHVAGLVLFFDAVFDAGDAAPVVLSTGPLSPKTSYRQMVLYLPSRLAVSRGAAVSGELTWRRVGLTGYTIEVHVMGPDERQLHQQKYYLSGM